MVNTRALLEDLQDDTDLALDYIEHEVGANRFVTRWAHLKQTEDPVAKVKAWMAKIGAAGDPAALVKIIDELASAGTKWLTPFTRTIPPEDDLLPDVSKRKKRRMRARPRNR